MRKFLITLFRGIMNFGRFLSIIWLRLIKILTDHLNLLDCRIYVFGGGQAHKLRFNDTLKLTLSKPEERPVDRDSSNQ